MIWRPRVISESCICRWRSSSFSSLNSPKETEETLLQSVESYKKVASILGEERVFPLMFFLGIQPNTDLEHRLLEEGYLSAGYNPLMLTPTSIRKRGFWQPRRTTCDAR